MSETLEMAPRNDPLGFAQRSYINVRIIGQGLEEKGEGHVVTQLVQSILGYIVFQKSGITATA